MRSCHCVVSGAVGEDVVVGVDKLIRSRGYCLGRTRNLVLLSMDATGI